MQTTKQARSVTMAAAEILVVTTEHRSKHDHVVATAEVLGSTEKDGCLNGCGADVNRFRVTQESTKCRDFGSWRPTSYLLQLAPCLQALGRGLQQQQHTQSGSKSAFCHTSVDTELSRHAPVHLTCSDSSVWNPASAAHLVRLRLVVVVGRVRLLLVVLLRRVHACSRA